MIVIKGQTVFCDVDDTLVLHKGLYDPSDEPNAVDIVLRTRGTSAEWMYGRTKFTFHVVPHKEHIEHLRKQKAEGKKIVVWSRGGDAWAECVVRFLGLHEKEKGGDGTVDLVLTKPFEYVDDVDANNFMKQVYLPHVSPNGKEIKTWPLAGS